VLNQGASVQSAVVSTTYANLDILPCGTRSSRAPELLGSAQMAQLLARFRGTYGVIIVDSPPMGAGVDAFALGTLTGNLVMVLRTGETDREMTEAKLETLNRLPIRILGVVLNDVRTGREGGFYYGYYSYYLPGYEAEDEDTQMDENRLIQRVES
jgi:Mrp family chromosome partitioning ATPase